MTGAEKARAVTAIIAVAEAKRLTADLICKKSYGQSVKVRAVVIEDNSIISG
jgi:hypothetical protein